MKFGNSGLLSSDSLGCTDMEIEYPILCLFVFQHNTRDRRKTGLVLYPDSVNCADCLGHFGSDPSLL